MADILIKGMDMPTMPETFKQAESVPYIDVRIFADGTAVTSKGERPYYTQYSAVPIPPHGRLIDADRALGRMWNALYALEDKREEQHGLDVMERANIQDGFEAGQRVVADAPTVIEASEDGEQNG